jgi:hypothetical protein
VSQSPAGVFNPVEAGDLGPVAPLYFSALTAPERAVAFMAALQLDAISTATTTDTFWVAGVGNPIGVYESESTALTRSVARYASRPLITSPDDAPGNTPIEARLTPFDVTRAIQFEGGGLIAPVAESAIGTVILANGDGSLDALDQDVAIVGREIEISAAAMTGDTVVGSTIFDVLATEDGFVVATESGVDLATGDGGSTSVLDGFGSIYKGVVEAIGWDRGSAQITVRDFRIKMQQPVQRSAYNGLGGIDGPPEMAGVTKPKAFGNCRNVRPVLLDPARLIYQVHDGEMRAIDRVLDMGVPLTARPIVKDLATLAALEPPDEESDGDFPLGSFVPCPAAGCFRLAGQPAGAVTADIRGAGGADSLRELFADGTLFSDGTGFRSAALLVYSRTAGAVISRLLIDCGLSDSEVSLTQISQMDRERPYEVGVYLEAGGGRTVNDVVGLLARSMGCVLIRTLDGRYQLRDIVPPRENPVIPVDIDAQDQGKLIRKALPYRQPWSDVDVVYNRNWSPLGESDLAGAVAADQRNLLTRDVFVSRVTDAELAAVYPDRAPLRIETALTSDGDALALGRQLLDFYTRGRQMFSVPLRGVAYRLELMDSIRLTAPRFGLDNGKDLLVVGLRENGASLATDVELFG